MLSIKTCYVNFILLTKFRWHIFGCLCSGLLGVKRYKFGLELSLGLSGKVRNSLD